MSHTRKLRKARNARDRAIVAAASALARATKAERLGREAIRMVKDIQYVINRTLPRSDIISHMAGCGMHVPVPMDRLKVMVEEMPEMGFDRLVEGTAAYEPLPIKQHTLDVLITEYHRYNEHTGAQRIMVSVGDDRVAFNSDARAVMSDEHMTHMIAKSITQELKRNPRGK